MLRNYLVTALRNLRRNKVYGLVNALGLSIGMAAGLLLLLVILYETSFDDFHRQKKEIYRLGTVFHNQDGESYSGGVALPVATALKTDFPEVKEVARIFKNGGEISIPQPGRLPKKLEEHDLYYTEPSFFKLFDFEFLAGDPEAALKDPYSAVLTQQTAEKFFGDWRTALGKTFKYDNKDVYKVTGILKNIPPNTDFPLSVVVPFAALEHTGIKDNLNDWVSTFSDALTFFTLKNGADLDRMQKRFPAFVKKHKPAEYSSDSFIAQPLSEMHYDPHLGNFNYHTFSHALVRVLLLIGLFLILVACVNFINLATAHSLNRAKEVGVRKTLGSSRHQLAFQFLMETALVVCFSLLLALGWAYLALHPLNQLLEVSLSLGLLATPLRILYLVLGVLIIILASGLYPSLILSGFNPVTALKQKNKSKTGKGITVRRTLVVLQFAIAQVLIIGMLIVVSQMHYFRNTSMGFDQSFVITVPLPEDSISHTKVDYVRNALLTHPDIQAVSFSYASPSSEFNWNSDFRFDHASKKTEFGANLKWADPAYFSLYGLKFVAGHPYTASDTVREFVVNETLLKKLGIRHPSEAIGKQIDFWDGKKTGPIVGVVRDFHALSFHRPMVPVLLSTWKEIYQVINIRIRPHSDPQVLPFIEKTWNSAFPDYVYSYRHLDETISGYYKYEDQLAQLYKIFAGIAIFISCIGLYGLVSFMALQRTKELGIRKVLGASAGQIVILLSKEFTLLILIAYLVSAPVAFYTMSNWLNNFPFRISPGLVVFASALLASIVIAWLSVGYRALLASLANPIQSLRTE